jgi:hypothetical protein
LLQRYFETIKMEIWKYFFFYRYLYFDVLFQNGWINLSWAGRKASMLRGRKKQDDHNNCLFTCKRHFTKDMVIAGQSISRDNCCLISACGTKTPKTRDWFQLSQEQSSDKIPEMELKSPVGQEISGMIL